MLLLVASILDVLEAATSTLPVAPPAVLVVTVLFVTEASALLSTEFVAITPLTARLKPAPNALRPLDVATASAVASIVAFSVAAMVTSPAVMFAFST